MSCYLIHLSSYFNFLSNTKSCQIEREREGVLSRFSFVGFLACFLVNEEKRMGVLIKLTFIKEKL